MLLEASKVISYDHQSGIILREDRKNSLGSLDKDGYLIIKIKGLQWKAHRLAWAKYYGQSPKYNIDHINGIKTDNRICNLRDAPQQINVDNTKKNPNKNTNSIGIYMDKKTKGLLSIYRMRIKGKAYGFRDLKSAISFRIQNNLPV